MVGLDADEGPIFQSDRMFRSRDVIDQWLDEGKAERPRKPGLVWPVQQHIISMPAEEPGDALRPFLLAAGLGSEDGPSACFGG